MSELDLLLSRIESAENSSQTRKNWNPDRVGEIDIRIDADGAWHHEGRAFKRLPLVKLFASVLRREQDDYFLVTPAEKLKIQVDDAPFVATTLEILSDNQQQALVFTSNLGDKIVADREHSIRVEIDPISEIPRPYIHFRDNLDALISRTAFFDLLNIAEVKEIDKQHFLTVSSMGVEFNLGCTDE